MAGNLMESPGAKAALRVAACAPVELDAFRRSMRRFARRYAELPVETRATCPACGQVVDATFERAGGQVVLRYRCERCGEWREAHHDRIWTDVGSDFPGSAARTFHGARVRSVIRRLPRTVETLCPECGAVVLGRYFVQGGAVHIEKTCPEHGYFRDCVNSDALLFSKASWWTFEEQAGQRFPQVAGTGHCPSDCGLCHQHLSSPCLAQIDLTNRCNMRCPVCFANAGVSGYVCQPDYDEVVRQLQALRDLRPIPCTAIQFTGGEPTVHPDFLKIVSTAREMGFSHIQIATNGLTLADESFTRRAAAAGLHTLYLQFDGVGEEAHHATRNYPGLWEKKLACIENCRKTGLKICLVPTILKGVNDAQVGEIFRFAVANVDVISAISYQPVSFSGRIGHEQRAAQRYTLGDLAHDIAAASSAVPLRDMYPLSIVMPLAQILEALTGKPKVRPSCHPDCAFGTYFLVSPEGRAVPFPQVINVEGMFWEMNRIAARIRRRGRATWLDRWRTWRMFKRHFCADQVPPGLTLRRFVRSLQGLVDKNVGRGEGEKLTYKTLLCAGMHFQDRYNYDVERAKRCVILYSTPGGIFPFCTYNCGPQYRLPVERAYAESGAGAARNERKHDHA
ncbi:MAG TPA: radical SAM protein [Phycisphaerales bacterium]|nr:radical SAM protein [Phycisphaerales bacterium]